MPTRYRRLDPVNPSELPRTSDLPAMEEFKTTFPRRSFGAADTRAAFKRWQDQQPTPAPHRNPDDPVQAIRPSRASIAKLRAVADSDAGPAEMLNQAARIGLARVISCFHCTAAWVSLAVVGAMYEWRLPTIAIVVAVAGAVSGD